MENENANKTENKEHIAEQKYAGDVAKQLLEEEKGKENLLSEIELAKLKEKKLAEKEKNKIQLKRDKAKYKAELKEKKLEIKRERQKQKRNTKYGVGGWITAVISLGVACLILSSVIAYNFLTPSVNDNTLDSVYKKSFYDCITQVDNIDLNLSKAINTIDSSAMQTYLVDTAINSELLENNIQQLPIEDESKYYTTKLINQIGDYSKYLNKKLANDERLTNEETENLIALYNANVTLKESFQKMLENMGDNYTFLSLNENDKVVIENFNQLQNLSVSYPKLIYDGPFSDGQDEREIKGLSGEVISKAEALEVFKKTFSGYEISEVNLDGESTGNIETYNVSAKTENDYIYAQISKLQGKIIMFDISGSCKKVNLEQDDAVENAKNFLTAIGVDNMKAVWVNLNNNVYTINFAYEQEEIIVYSDLIKVRVCAETGKVIGIEASSYYTNHTVRDIETPSLSVSVCSNKVSGNIVITTSRLVIVPIGETAEKLCYEYSGNADGSLYYVYIDANSGKQVEMFKVIESTEGELLM